MGTLGYDPDRLTTLAVALGQTADELAALSSADPEAQTALAVAGNARRALADWRARIAAIVSCSPLAGYQPLALDPADLPQATMYVLSRLYGWRTTSDPAGPTSWVPPAMRGAAVGHLISTGQVGAATAEDAARLRAELDAVMLDPAARAAFAANLTTAGAIELVGQLSSLRAEVVTATGGPAGVRHGSDAEAVATVASVDGALAVVADTLIDVDGPIEQATAALGTLNPFQAALLVANLDADDEVIGQLAMATLARYADGDDPANWPLPWEEASTTQFGAGDLLFPRLARGDAATCNRVVASLLALDPNLLVATVGDARSVIAIVGRATDPAAVGAAAAGAVLVPYLGYLADPPEHPDVTSPAHGEVLVYLPPSLGTLVAPWLAQFTVDADTWGWTEDDGARALAFAITDDAAFDDLLAAADRWLEALPIDPDATGTTDLFWELQAAGKMIGAVTELLRERAERRVVGDRWLWDAFTEQFPKLLNKGVSKAGVTGIPARVASKVIGIGVRQGKHLAEERGVPGAPPPLDDALRELDVGVDEVFVVGAYLAMGAMLEVLIATGEVPADTPWPPEPDAVDGSPASAYVDVTDDWLQGLGLDGDTLFAFVSARSAFLSGAQSKRSHVDLLPS